MHRLWPTIRVGATSRFTSQAATIDTTISRSTLVLRLIRCPTVKFDVAVAQSGMSPPATVREAIQSPTVRPSLDSFVDHFFVLAGGPEAVAAMLYDEFSAAKPGSVIRQRIMESVLRSLSKTDASKNREDMGPLSDEDLDNYLAEREQAITAHLQPRLADGVEATSPGPVEPGAAAAASPSALKSGIITEPRC